MRLPSGRLSPAVLTRGRPRALELAPRIPLGRLGTDAEVAQAVLMVVGNAYMTGQTIHLNGGMSFN